MRPMPAPLGLYIHIPFCKSKCVYCDFYSLPRSESRMDDYTDALCAHLAETAPFAAGHLVDTVYFGGGTPSYLGTKRLVKILKTILKKYKVDKQAEITLEANPDSAGDWKELRTLRRCGFNRLSLGMQSADDEELSEIGRVHTMAQTEAGGRPEGQVPESLPGFNLRPAPSDAGGVAEKPFRCLGPDAGASLLLWVEGRGGYAPFCPAGDRGSAGGRRPGGHVSLHGGVPEGPGL